MSGREKFENDIDLKRLDEDIKNSITCGIKRGSRERRNKKKLLTPIAATAALLVIVGVGIKVPVIGDTPLIKAIIQSISGDPVFEEIVDDNRGSELLVEEKIDNIVVKVLYGFRDKNSMDLVLDIEDTEKKVKFEKDNIIGFKDLHVRDNQNNILFYDSYVYWHKETEGGSGVLELEANRGNDINFNELEGDIYLSGDIVVIRDSFSEIEKVTKVESIKIPMDSIKKNDDTKVYTIDKEVTSGDKKVHFGDVQQNTDDIIFSLGYKSKPGWISIVDFNIRNVQGEIVKDSKKSWTKDRPTSPDEDNFINVEKSISWRRGSEEEKYYITDIQLSYIRSALMFNIERWNSGFMNQAEDFYISDIRNEGDYTDIIFKNSHPSQVIVKNGMYGYSLEYDFYGTPEKIEVGAEMIPVYKDEKMRERDLEKHGEEAFENFHELIYRVNNDLFKDFHDSFVIYFEKTKEVYKFEGAQVEFK